MTDLASKARRWHPEALAGAAWAAVALQLVRHRLRRHGLQAEVPRPPHLGPHGARGVVAALRRLSPTCLERALVEQAWLASRGTELDVVIGVPREGFTSGPAHAWLEGALSGDERAYVEIHRLSPRRDGPRSQRG